MTCVRLGIITPCWMSFPGRLHGRKGSRRPEEALHTPSKGFRHLTMDVVPQNYTHQHSRGGTCLRCASHKTKGHLRQMSSIHGTSRMRSDAEFAEGTILVARYGKGICLGPQEL